MTDGSAPSSSAFDWDVLLRSISRETVIPIIGPELLPYHQLLAPEFAAKLGVAPDAAQRGVVGVADEYMRAPRDALYWRELERLIQQRRPPASPALEVLAGVEEFRLLITTDYSDYVEKALKGTTRSVAFNPKGTDELELYPKKTEPRVVYHLLGQFSDVSVALPHVMQLEWLYALQLREASSGLLNILRRRNNLLFLGCDFPEWLSGFFLRILLGKPLYESYDRGIELVASRVAGPPTSPLTVFLRNNRVQIFDGDAEAFVRELGRRYKPPASASDPGLDSLRRSSRGRAFVSYRRADRDLVRKFVQELRQQEVEVWFDESDLEPGDRFANEIKLAIQEDSSAFIPILSRESLDADAGFFIREWNWAVEATQGRKRDVNYVFPTILGEVTDKDIGGVTDKDIGGVTDEEARKTLIRSFPEFAQANFFRYVPGNLDPRLVVALFAARRRFERNASGREVRP